MFCRELWSQQRSGTKAVSRLLRAAAEADPRATNLSVDAVGAFDYVSRQATLSALAAVRSSPSSCMPASSMQSRAHTPGIMMLVLRAGGRRGAG